MNSPEHRIVEPIFSPAALRPLASLVVFAVVAVLALAGAATLATFGP